MRSRAADRVARCIAIGPGRWDRERGNVEPLIDGRIAQYDGQSGCVGAKRTVRTATDVARITNNPSCKRRARGKIERTVQLPVAEPSAGQTVPAHPTPVPAEWQLPQVVAVEALRLVEVRKRSLGSQIQSVLRNIAGGGSKTGRVIDRLRPRVTASNRYSILKAATKLNPADVSDRVTGRRFPCERLNSEDPQTGRRAVWSLQNIQTRS